MSVVCSIVVVALCKLDAVIHKDEIRKDATESNAQEGPNKSTAAVLI